VPAAMAGPVANAAEAVRNERRLSRGMVSGSLRARQIARSDGAAQTSRLMNRRKLRALKGDRAGLDTDFQKIHDRSEEAGGGRCFRT